MVKIVKEGVKAYKLSKDYKNQKIKFSTKAYLIRKHEVWTKVISHFPDLDLTFMDEKLETKDEPTLEAEGTPNPCTNCLNLFFSFHTYVFALSSLE